MKIDLDTCRRAMRNIYVQGVPNTTERTIVIEKAINAIQLDGQGAMRAEYMGLKNYAHFGDQGSSGPYGTGPRHGSIVFAIGRVDRGQGDTALGADEIYYLEAVRDFGGIEDPDNQQRHIVQRLNLGDVIRRHDTLIKQATVLRTAIEAADIEPSI